MVRTQTALDPNEDDVSDLEQPAVAGVRERCQDWNRPSGLPAQTGVGGLGPRLWLLLPSRATFALCINTAPLPK
jgi:hypothetical protein